MHSRRGKGEGARGKKNHGRIEDPGNAMKSRHVRNDSKSERRPVSLRLDWVLGPIA
jgi:hypothetical protein